MLVLGNLLLAALTEDTQALQPALMEDIQVLQRAEGIYRLESAYQLMQKECENAPQNA